MKNVLGRKNLECVVESLFNVGGMSANDGDITDREEEDRDEERWISVNDRVTIRRVLRERVEVLRETLYLEHGVQEFFRSYMRLHPFFNVVNFGLGAMGGGDYRLALVARSAFLSNYLVEFLREYGEECGLRWRFYDRVRILAADAYERFNIDTHWRRFAPWQRFEYGGVGIHYFFNHERFVSYMNGSVVYKMNIFEGDDARLTQMPVGPGGLVWIMGVGNDDVLLDDGEEEDGLIPVEPHGGNVGGAVDLNEGEAALVEDAVEEGKLREYVAILDRIIKSVCPYPYFGRTVYIGEQDVAVQIHNNVGENGGQVEEEDDDDDIVAVWEGGSNIVDMS
jgi:hypothetical protein